ncbi:hypothetical protein [Actinomadura flavalba]|uniref:hypothetical protein n=1 Tax=Actinomadura flavalba TaxID=1120938 RepID=UPI000377CE98|nr:hypothetical protein [Actinomadura flavalba]
MNTRARTAARTSTRHLERHGPVIDHLRRRFPTLDPGAVEDAVRAAADCAEHLDRVVDDRVVEHLAADRLRGRLATHHLLPEAKPADPPDGRRRHPGDGARR